MYYAQRKEDEKLRGLLPDRNQGFYVDVGAWKPTLDSVTKHFYDDGWNGINIEPIPTFFQEMADARPRDVNLNIAVGSKLEHKEIIYMPGTGLSTFVREHADLFPGYQKELVTVPVLTLDAVLRTYVPRSQSIDFLKIDVEGWEKDVLLGATQMLKYWGRPRILVIEATIPGTDTPAWDDWDHIPIEAGYEFLEFDGLNRWYRAQQPIG